MDAAEKALVLRVMSLCKVIMLVYKAKEWEGYICVVMR
jgi:hypothetical protein